MVRHICIHMSYTVVHYGISKKFFHLRYVFRQRWITCREHLIVVSPRAFRGFFLEAFEHLVGRPDFFKLGVNEFSIVALNLVVYLSLKHINNLLELKESCQPKNVAIKINSNF
jgi:hypothetical protein